MGITKSSQKGCIYLFNNIKNDTYFFVAIGHMINILYRFQDVEQKCNCRYLQLSFYENRKNIFIRKGGEK